MIEIPGYKIKREIGRGGMAKVYLATHEGLQRDVAIKIMFKNLGKDSEYSERFIREARIVAQLSHHNIITVFDVGVHEDNHYIAMELLPGETLDDKIKAGISPEYSLELLKQISSGLQYAHDKKFIHRDIKPENILFREDDTPVISDFGIARATESDTKMTAEGTVIGTAIYMSPEQAQGHAISNCADIYSLGIVFYEMLTGQVPYKADSSIGTAFKHIKDPIPTLDKENKRYQSILNKFLAKDPKDRYQSCKEITADIDALNQDESSPRATEFIAKGGHGTEFINITPKPGNRWKKIAGISGVVLLTGFATAYTLIYLPQQQLQQEEVANQKRIEEKQKEIDISNKKLKAEEKKRLADEIKNKKAAEQKAKLDKIAADKILADKIAAENLAAEQKAKEDRQRLKEKNALETKRLADKSRLAAEKKKRDEEDKRKKQVKIDNLLTNAETILLKTKLSSLLEDADTKLLTAQLNDSYNNFRAVLKIDQKNTKAKSGIDQVAQQFLDMAVREATKKNYDIADNYVKNVIDIAPTYVNLASTQQEINALRDAHKTTETETPTTVKKPKNSRPSFVGF